MNYFMENIVIFTTDKQIRGKLLTGISELEGYKCFFFDNLNSIKTDLELINPQFLLTTANDFGWILKIEKVKEALSDQLKVILIKDAEILPEATKTYSPICISRDFKIHELTEAINRTYDFSNGWMKSSGILNLLLQNIPIALFWKDKNLRYLGCNKIFADDYGLKNAKDVIGLTDQHIFDEALAKKYNLLDNEIINSGLPKIGYEEKFKNLDGSTEYLKKSKIPIKDKDGEVVAIMGMYEKITAQKIAEKELVEEQRYMQLLMDNIPDRIYFKDQKSRFTRVNKAMVELFGKQSPKDLYGKNDFDFLEAEQAKKTFSNEQKLIEKGEPLINHIEFYEKNGVKRWVSETKIPLKNKQGKSIGLVGVNRDVTKQIQLEEDLIKEKELLESLMNNSPDTIYFKDNNSKFIKINKAQAKLLGIKNPNEAIGKSDFDFFEEEHAQWAFNDEQELIKSGDPLINKIEKVKSPEGYKYISSTKVPLFDNNGKTIGIVGISRDVTKQKTFELQLQEEKDFLQKLMDNIPDRIYFKDRESKFRRANMALTKLFGKSSSEELFGKSDFDFLDKDHAEETYNDEQEIMESGKPLINHIESFEKEGKRLWVSATKIPLKGQDGNCIGIVGINRDMTEQKTFELQLTEERDLLQTLMDNIPDTIYFKDKESRFTRVNRAMASVLGIYNPSECIGRTDFDYFSEEQAQDSYSDERAILETGIPLINKVEKIKKNDKSIVWLSSTKIPLRNDDGEVTGLVGISRDVSSQELAKRSLQFAKEKAEEANKTKSVFLANMSHDIRTPMNGVIGMADILKRTDLSEEQCEYLDIIIKSGSNLLAIINDILDFSKIESGKMELEMVPVSIRSIVEDVGDVLVMKANNKGINLVTYVDPNMPGMVSGDEVRMRQILINLLNNAIKFTSEGEVFISAEVVKNEHNKCEILFKVKDTGIGIPKDSISKLFQSFTQVDASTTRKFGGTGLGLAICKKLVEQMGGKIGLESELDKGSVFWFSVDFDISEHKPSKVIYKQESFKDLNFLIIDDNKTNRVIFKKYFEIWGCKSDEAVNGKVAIDVMKKAAMEGKTYDLALVDYQMAEMDGLDFAREVKKDPQIANTKLILLSSVSNILAKGKEKEAGFEAYLNKPIKLKQLFNVISNATGQVVESAVTEIAKTKPVFKNDKLRVLIVEDNEINMKVAELSVKTVTNNISKAENGKIAFELFIQHNFDIILMDVQMPVMNGYEATEKIREHEKSTDSDNPVKIIAMTANAMKEDKQLCLEVGMDAYLSKPFKSGDFIRILEELKI